MQNVNFPALADEIAALQAKVDKINEAAKAKTEPLEQEIKDKEQKLQLAMQSAGLEAITGKKSTAVIESSLKVSITDPSMFFSYISRYKQHQLLYRRVSVEAYRELKAAGRSVPGIAEYDHRVLKVKPVKQKQK